MSSAQSNEIASTNARCPNRKMVRAEVMGGHTHATLRGDRVHIWQRNGTFLARGRYQGRPFGATLGANILEATAGLRQLLTDIENGSFVRPSEARQRPLPTGKIPRLTLRQLINEFLGEKRKLRGRRTGDNYRARLMPVIEFAEQSAALQQWPLATNINRNFVIELRAFLLERHTTRNGRPQSREQRLSDRQVYNILECLRSLLTWGTTP